MPAPAPPTPPPALSEPSSVSAARPGPASSTRACPSPRNLRDSSDGHLMEQMRSGSVAAFEELHRRFRADGLARAARVCGPVLAEDALQEAFTSIWRSAGAYRAELGAPRTWILGIVRNRAIDTLRRNQRHDQRRTGEERLAGVAAQQHVEHEALRREEARSVQSALPALPAAQRNVLELSFFEGLSQHEIAGVTGAPLGTVKGRTRLALARLRGDLLATGFVVSG